MKTLKTYNQLFEQNFLNENDELDYDKWYKTWTISKDPKYTKLTSNNTGWLMFEFPPLEPFFDESPTFYEVEWDVSSNMLRYEVSVSDFSALEVDQEDMLANYIMFNLLEDEKVKIDWFIDEQDIYFTEKLAMKYDNLFDYLILLKEAEKIKKRKRFNI